MREPCPIGNDLAAAIADVEVGECDRAVVLGFDQRVDGVSDRGLFERNRAVMISNDPGMTFVLDIRVFE